MKSLCLLVCALFVSTFATAQSELAKAIMKGNLEKVEAFIESEKDLDALHIEDRYTCLNLAVKAEQLEVVKILLEAGANPETMSNGKTPLMYAAKYGKLEIAKYLLKKGADKTFQNAKGRTALDYARKYEQVEMQVFLKQ